MKIQLIGKDPDAGKDWKQKGKKVAEDEMVSFTNSMDMNLSKLQDIVKDRRARQLNNNNILLRKFCLLILRKYQ